MTNPYLLPAGNVQIAFNGGRTSGYLLRQILDANGGLPDDELVLTTFQNTGREMPETLDFVAEVGSRWGVPIAWLEYQTSGPLAGRCRGTGIRRRLCAEAGRLVDPGTRLQDREPQQRCARR